MYEPESGALRPLDDGPGLWFDANAFSPDDRKRVLDACEAFAYEPWIAVYVETADSADVYLISLEHYDKKYRSKRAEALDGWNMSRKSRDAYAADPDVKHLHIDFTAVHWWAGGLA